MKIFIAATLLLILSCSVAEASSLIRFLDGRNIEVEECKIDGNDITYRLPGSKKIYHTSYDEVEGVSNYTDDDNGAPPITVESTTEASSSQETPSTRMSPSPGQVTYSNPMWKAVRLTIENKNTQEKEEILANIGETTQVPGTRLQIQPIEFIPEFIMQGLAIASASNEQKNPAVKLLILEDNKEIFKGWLFKNFPTTHAFSHPEYEIKLIEGVTSNIKGSAPKGFSSAPVKPDTKINDLYEAVMECDVLAVKRLLEAGADPNGMVTGVPVFHYAVGRSFVDKSREMVRMMLKYGAKANIKSDNGATPLMCCSDIKIARMLIERGANVNAMNDAGITPLNSAVRGNSLDLVKYFIKHGADINIKGNNDYTPLGIAASKEEEIAIYLIDSGVNVNSKNGLSQATPLMEAAESGLIKVVRKLLDKKANVNAKDINGRTALEYVKKTEYKNRMEIEMLKEKMNGSIALDFSKVNENQRTIIKMLKAAGAR